MGFSSLRRAYYTKTAPNNETQPFCKCAHVPTAKPILAKHGRRANAKHGPNRSKPSLKIDDFRIGGALTRREQPPEPQQITSEK